MLIIDGAMFLYIEVCAVCDVFVSSLSLVLQR